MKSTLRNLILLIFIFLSIAACKKNDSGTPFKKLQTSIYSDGSNETLEYSSNGKVSKNIYKDGIAGSTFTTTFIYSGNTITQSQNSSQSGTTSVAIIYLNSQGYMSNITGTDGAQTHVTTYEYDNSGYCTKETYSEAQNSEITTYTYSNGNLSSSTYTSNGYNETHSFEYFLDKENTLNYEHSGVYFMGNTSKNLVKKEILISGTSSTTYTYVYDYDKDNYVTKKTATSSNGAYSWVSYLYK